MRTHPLIPAAAVAFVCAVCLETAHGGHPPQTVGAQGAAQAPAGGQGQILGGVGAPGRGQGPAGPAPRRPDGRVLLSGATPDDRGLWLPGRGGAQTLIDDDAPLPMQPWAAAVLDDRRRQQLEPHTRCKPSGVARQFLTPYGVEIVDLPELQRIYIFDVGGPQTYRTIHLDGRTHPTRLTRSFYGHSIGWWDGDTLVVDTVGFNEGFWLDRRGAPHTQALHTIERFTRTDARTIRYELDVDDPGAYTARWRGGFDLGWSAGEELFEYVCQQANYADTLMVGEHASVDRSTPIVP